MLVGQNITEYFFSFGGAIFAMLVFAFSLFGAELLGWMLRRGAKKAGIKRQLFATQFDEGQCPL